MSNKEHEQAEELLHAIQNEPTMFRIFSESPRYDFGGSFIVFDLKGIRWKLALTIVKRNVVKKTEKLTSKEAKKLFPKPKNTKL